MGAYEISDFYLGQLLARMMSPVFRCRVDGQKATLERFEESGLRGVEGEGNVLAGDFVFYGAAFLAPGFEIEYIFHGCFFMQS